MVDPDENAARRGAQHEQVTQWRAYFEKTPPSEKSPSFWHAFKEVVDYSDYLEGKMIQLRQQLAQKESICQKFTTRMKRLFLR